MANRSKETIWKAKPHTIAKIAILRDYLYAYLQILGRSRPGATILYIDGFAGPGEYTNYDEGSPLAALRAAIKAKEDAIARNKWQAASIHLCFVERNRKRYEHLTNLLSKNSQHPLMEDGSVCVHAYRGTFVENLPKIRKDVPSPFTTKDPLFAFLDPFGATGVPFSTVKELLQSPSSELLLNFDGDGVARILRASQTNFDIQLNEVYGGEFWRERLEGIDNFAQQCREALHIYQERLHSLPQLKYTFPFEMQKTNTAIDYWLVFASKHPLGIEKMKEAMKRPAQNGDYRFCDAIAQSQQTRLEFDFSENDVPKYAPQLLEHFAGQKLTVRPYELPRDFALNRTPLLNPKKMLAHLERQGLLRVEPTAPKKRRKGTFKEGKFESLHFAPFDGGN